MLNPHIKFNLLFTNCPLFHITSIDSQLTFFNCLLGRGCPTLDRANHSSGPEEQVPARGAGTPSDHLRRRVHGRHDG